MLDSTRLLAKNAVAQALRDGAVLPAQGWISHTKLPPQSIRGFIKGFDTTVARHDDQL